MFFLFGIHRAILSRLSLGGKGKTFSYYFDGDTELNVWKIDLAKKPNLRGACHADDLFYLFSSEFSKKPAIDSTEFKLITKMVDIWTEFAINGNANNETWKPISSIDDAFSCLKICNEGCEMIQQPERERLKVWRAIYEAEKKALF